MSALPEEKFIYLGDTARLPYGSKSPQTIERYLVQNIRFLRTYDVKAVVVACNSASTVLLGRDLKLDVPIYNVIEPGAKAALAATKTNRIGVLGTKATISAQAYVKAIHQFSQATDTEAFVAQQACPLLVPLVEEGWDSDPLTNLVIFRYLTPILSQGIDTLILGCTHYPVLRNGILKVTGPNIHLVDSAEAIAEAIKTDISASSLGKGDATSPSVQILTTDDSPGFFEIAVRLMQPHTVPALQTVDIGSV